MARLRRVWAWLERFAADPGKTLVVDGILIAFVLGLLVYVIVFVTNTNDTLCKFRGLRERQAARSEAFLAAHRNQRIFTFGDIVITRDSIEKDVADQEAVLRSLRGLHC